MARKKSSWSEKVQSKIKRKAKKKYKIFQRSNFYKGGKQVVESGAGLAIPIIGVLQSLDGMASGLDKMTKPTRKKKKTTPMKKKIKEKE